MTVIVPVVYSKLLILLLLSSMSGETGRDDDENKRRWLVIDRGEGNSERKCTCCLPVTDELANVAWVRHGLM